MTLLDVLISLCCIGLALFAINATHRAESAEASVVALKAQYARMDCVKVIAFQGTGVKK